MLVIAHRLSTIKNADQIIVLQNGQVENTGTHQQLLDGDALYQDMWEAHIGAQNWSAGSGKGGNGYVSDCKSTDPMDRKI